MKRPSFKPVLLRLFALAVSLSVASMLTSRAQQVPAPTPDDARLLRMHAFEMNQGLFAMRVLQRAGGEQLAPRTLTPVGATELLSGIGFVPYDGWSSDQLLTKRLLDSAYQNLVDTIGISDKPQRMPEVVVAVRTEETAPGPGQDVACRLLAGNRGFSDISNVSVRVDMPSFLGNLRSKVAAFDGSSGTWKIDQLRQGEIKVLDLTATAADQKPAQPGQIMASVVPATTAGAHWGIMLRQPPALLADVGVRIVASNVTPAVDEEVTFTVIVTNRGPDRAANIELLNELPVELKLKERTGGTVTSNGWMIGELAPGGSVSLGLLVKAGAPHTNDIWVVTNVARVVGMSPVDPNEVGNRAESEVLIGFVERVGLATIRALLPTTTERQPVSASRPLRR